MSDKSDTNRRIKIRAFVPRRRRRQADAGMTLPELTISVAITGILIATLSMATTVILRQMDNTEGRTNNARSEQNVSLFMPADLSSAETVNTDASALPCGPTPSCPPEANISGSNALMLSWTGQVFDTASNAVVSTRTTVSYRVVETVTGEFQMLRVECYSVANGAPTCETRIVLRELDPPPVGTAWVPGITPPSWIMTVSQAAAADDTSGPGVTTPPVDPGLRNKNAQRVVVTINGGGDVAGAGGGQNQISLSAGGTNRDTNLTTDDLAGAPTFTAARSRCGGNFGVVVDKSGSIGSDMGTVRTGVKAFIDSFAGTPVKLQVVTFSDTAQTLGSGSGWTKYYDMLIESDVTALKGLVDGVNSGGSTNWEDGFFRMLRNSDGTVQAQLPNTVLFFTDGVPTRSRLDGTSASAAAVADPVDGGLPASDGSTFYQIGWNRTERLIRDRGSINLIGVYVSGSTGATSTWKVAGAGYHTIWQSSNALSYEYKIPYEKANTVIYQKGYHPLYELGNTVVFERGYHGGYQVGNTVVYEQGYHNVYERGNTVVWEKGYHNVYERSSSVAYQYSSTGLSYEKLSGGSWVAAGTGGATSANSRTTYLSNNPGAGEADGWRVRVSGTLGPTWTTTTPAEYDKSNTLAGQTDGYKTTGTNSGTWTAITQAVYDLSNTTAADATDGYRVTQTFTAPYDTWASSTEALYLAGNSVPAETDGWRTRATGTPTSWTTQTQAQYDASNLTTDSTDGWRVTQTFSAPYDLWASVTQSVYQAGNTVAAATDGWRTRTTGTPTSWAFLPDASLYNESNLTADATDGWQTANEYTSPYSLWESATPAAYEAGNTTTDSTDGWRNRLTGTPTTWAATTSSLYAEGNTTADASDGWRLTPIVYSSPYTNWETTDLATYTANNTTSGGTDGWQTALSGSATSWTVVDQATYDLNNTTTDSTDGWRTYQTWAPTTAALYLANNVNNGSTDNWRATMVGSTTSWTEVTQTQYNASNVNSGETDGWRSAKSYTEPFTAYENPTDLPTPIKNYATIGNLVVDNTSGYAGNFIIAQRQNGASTPTNFADDSGPYTNAAVADLFVLPDYNSFGTALASVALDQCGGTVTLQTKVGTSSAQDPFTYENSSTHEVVTTSAAYRSGTFDVALPGGASTTVTISPQDFTNLVRYQPAGWTCKSGGTSYPFTVTPIPLHAPWTSITMTVNPNQAVSCVQQVTIS